MKSATRTSQGRLRSLAQGSLPLIATAAAAATITVISSLAASPLHAATPTIGHNVSPTSYTLRKGDLTLGSYAVGYGITDNWMIATSPWVIIQYNMPMISTRYSFKGDELIHRFAFEFDYFKTFQYGFNHYKQESFFARLVATHQFSAGYTIHLSAGYQHFFDDTAPYSIRPTWYLSDPTTLSAGALHEVSLDRDWGLFVETASLGLNFPVPYAHLGLSLFTKGEWGLAQVGVSRSMPLGSPGWYIVRTGGGTNEWVYMKDASFHPEIQVQFTLN